MTNPNDPAFPLIAENGLGHISPGQTKREYFAAMALPACISSLVSVAGNGNNLEPRMAAMAAVEYADLLIEELSKKNSL